MGKKNASARGRASRQKGKRGERELAERLRALGIDSRRGVQFQGGKDSPDVTVPDWLPIHPECKRTESLHAYPALAQATEDAADWEMPAVFHRQSGKPWIVILGLEDFARIARMAFKPEESKNA